MGKITIGGGLVFYSESEAYSGVRKIAEKVKSDIEMITDYRPVDVYTGQKSKAVIIYGTIGKSVILDKLSEKQRIDLSRISEKREVFMIRVIENPTEEITSALVIAGSDKRGTIYGLFHLSELLGVAPLVNWNHLWPQKKKEIVLSDSIDTVSKEPSVKYRGFFINDEWPAFGTWATEHFGGINAKCYESVFELLLRLKGNYLWPAMWHSNFNLDGPGLANAELADEYGIVMSTSHHEPCMRSGEEYEMFRGKDSIYGNAWDFNLNPEGITRFWKDGLLRNRNFENVITMGMRGENDTAIMQNASLEDNIDLFRRVLKTQNALIKETICEDLTKVPRQMVLFTEVEEFFYGNKDVKGLMDDPELDGITLMLSDNNHGSTRTLPNEKKRNHKGGYGMYYHMDMHGGAHSFQWIGATYLPKVWEQMTAAYEYGVREIWVTNIGDIATQEFGLSYFLDLAYNIDKWGGTDAKVTEVYVNQWVASNFSHIFKEQDLKSIEKIIWEYTALLARRKHEVMNDTVYHPVHFGESQDALDRCEEILNLCERLKKDCPKEYLAAFISLVYYPACGTANLIKLWIISGRNKLYALQNRVSANRLADMIPKLEEYDEQLVQEYMEVDDRFFYGFGLSEHIGFTTWCDEDNKYPLRTYIRPANAPRMIVSRVDDENYLTGDFWRDKPQVWNDATRPDIDRIDFEISRASKTPIDYRITTECPWISFSGTEGTVEETEKVSLFIKRELFEGKSTGEFTVENMGFTKAKFVVNAYNHLADDEKNCFWEHNGYVSISAEHFQHSVDSQDGGFKVLSPYGRTGSAIKVFPVTADFTEKDTRPYVEYDFLASRSGDYELIFYLSATTPVVYERRQYIGFSINDSEIQIRNTVEKEDEQFFLSAQWTKEAYNNIKMHSVGIQCIEGKNRLRFYGVSPAIVLEKIVIRRSDTRIPDSYLGPTESYFYR